MKHEFVFGGSMVLLKDPHVISPALRKWHQDHEAGCQIRLRHCQFSPTVGAHIPSGARFGKGVAYKPPDWPGLALACYSCHDAIDARAKQLNKEQRLLAWYEGMYQTMLIGMQDPKWLDITRSILSDLELELDG